MKKTILALAIILTALITFQSCSSSRGGCSATSGFMGYR